MESNYSDITEEQKEIFLLSLSSNLVAGQKGSVQQLERRLGALIKTYLLALGLEGWQIVWGPAIYQFAPLSQIADNAMVVFQKGAEFVVSIAGTNSSKDAEPFIKSFGWIIEDFLVGVQVPWEFGNPPQPDPKIALGTHIGFQILRSLQKDGQDLETFLKEQVENTDGQGAITVGGHSLGGALSAVVALWLSDIHVGWNGQVTIKCQPSAGPTPGNFDFAQYFDSQLAEQTTRIHNTLDIVPLSWDQIEQILNIYDEFPSYHLPEKLKPCIEQLVTELLNGQSYSQITIGSNSGELPGQINEGIDPNNDLSQFERYLEQVLYQHVNAYFDLLGLKRPSNNEFASAYTATPIIALMRKAAEIQRTAAQNIAISEVNYRGTVKGNQADEYVEVINKNPCSVDLTGWRVHAGSRDQNFHFPEGTVLAAGTSFRVYTNQIHSETGGFSFGSGRAIWRDKGDTAQLFDSEGNLVSTFSY